MIQGERIQLSPSECVQRQTWYPHQSQALAVAVGHFWLNRNGSVSRCVYSYFFFGYLRLQRPSPSTQPKVFAAWWRPKWAATACCSGRRWTVAGTSWTTALKQPAAIETAMMKTNELWAPPRGTSSWKLRRSWTRPMRCASPYCHGDVYVRLERWGENEYARVCKIFKDTPCTKKQYSPCAEDWEHNGSRSVVKGFLDMGRRLEGCKYLIERLLVLLKLRIYQEIRTMSAIKEFGSAIVRSRWILSLLPALGA